MRLRSDLLVLLSALLPLLLTPIQGTSFVRMSDADLADQAESIVLVEVTGVQGSGAVGRLETLYQARVVRWIKNRGEDRIQIAVPGGVRPDGSGLRIDAAPRFSPRQQALLFLKRRPDGSFGILQFLLGAFYRHDYRGRALALRNLEVAREFGDPSDNPQPPRDWQRFVDWLEQRSLGDRSKKDYWRNDLDAAEVQNSFRYALSKYQGDPIRWFNFDSAGFVNWRAHVDGQQGMSGGGFSEFQEALAAWNSVSAANVDYRYAGTTASTAEFDNTDGISAILFDDPNESIPGAFSCGAGGTLALGGTYFTISTQPYGAEPFHASQEGEIVTQNGAGCFFAGNGGQNGAEVFAHEVGHTLGLAHSTESNAIMRSVAYGDGRGASLASDDEEGIRFLYASGGAPPPQADLSLSVSDSPDPVVAGSTLTYVLSISNNGPSAASSVSLSSTLASQTTFSSSTPSSPTCGHSNGVVTCGLGSLNAGQSSQVTIQVNVVGTASGTLLNSSSVASTTQDPASANNSRNTATTVSSSGTDMAVSVQDSPDPVAPGGDITYQVAVTNNGPASSSGSNLSLTLPSGGSLISAAPSGCSGGGANWNCAVGSLPAGNSRNYSLLFRLNPQTTGQVQLQASIQAQESDPTSSNNNRTATTQISQLADLRLTKTDLVDPVSVGGDIRYRIVVTNLGPSSALNVMVSDDLPAGLELMSAPAGCNLLSGNRVRCSLGDLASGASQTLDLVVRAHSAGQFLNTASVSSSTTDPNSQNNADSEQTLVRGDTDLDGVPDAAENAAPHSGDGNQDGVPDRDQSHVASFPSIQGSYLTLAAPSGVKLESVSAQSPPALPSSLNGVQFPLGVIGFNVGDLSPGQAVSIALLMHSATAQLNSYYQYGATPGNAEPHWYDFLFDGDTGAELMGDRVILHLADGGRGDSDRSINGRISDPGGPSLDRRADLRLRFTSGSAAVNSGQIVRYQVEAENQGPFESSGVRLRFPLPLRAELVSASSSQGSCSLAGVVVECLLGKMGSQSNAQIGIQVRLNRAGANQSEFEVLALEPDPVDGNNQVLVETQVMPSVLVPVSLSPASDLFSGDFVGMAVYNPSQDLNPVLLEGFDPSGQSLALKQTPGLPGGGQFAMTSVEALDDPSIQTIEARGGDSPVQGFFLLGDNLSRRLDGVGAEVAESEGMDFLVARRGEGSATVLYLYNPGPDDASQVSITLRSVSSTAAAPSVETHTTTLALAAHSTLVAPLEDLFALTPGAADGWLSVSSDLPLRGIEFVADEESYLSMTGRQPEATLRLTAPHFFLDGNGGSSRLRLLNRGAKDVRARFLALDDSGLLIASAERTLKPNQLMLEAVGQLLGLSAASAETLTGFLNIELTELPSVTPKPALVSGAIEFGGPGYRTLLPLIAKGRRESLFLHVAQSAEFNLFTGFALLNNTSKGAQATLLAYDDQGLLTAQKSLFLPAGRRLVDLLDSPTFFGAAFQQVGGHIEVVSDQDLVTFVLFGDLGLRFLAAIESQE